MKLEEIKIGMKVYPVSKSVGGSSYEEIKKIMSKVGADFICVDGFDGEEIDCTFGGKGFCCYGFLPSDLITYEDHLKARIAELEAKLSQDPKTWEEAFKVSRFWGIDMDGEKMAYTTYDGDDILTLKQDFSLKRNVGFKRSAMITGVKKSFETGKELLKWLVE